MPDKFATAMADMASELVSEPLWRPYAAYLTLRGQRIQERAQQAAEAFAELARCWPYEERKRFSRWMLDRAGRVMEQIGSARNCSRGLSFVVPHVIIDAVLLPTIIEWRQREPNNPVPHFWAGLYSLVSWNSALDPIACLREALRLNPRCVPAREALARHILEVIQYNQHELPSGYVRDTPESDLTALREVEELLAEPVSDSVREGLKERIAIMRGAAENWIECCRERAAKTPR